MNQIFMRLDSILYYVYLLHLLVMCIHILKFSKFFNFFFRFSTILNRGNVNFKITDPNGLSNNLDGVIGSFIPLKSYQILKHVGDLGLLERF